MPHNASDVSATEPVRLSPASSGKDSGSNGAHNSGSKAADLRLTSIGPLDHFAVKLGSMGRLWRSHLERELKPTGLSLAQWQVLHYLSHAHEPLVQRDLAFAIGIDEPALVGVLDRLEASGTVRRKPAVHDRRAKTVHLTPLAGCHLERAEVVLKQMREELLYGIPWAELERATRLFDLITGRLWEAGRQKESPS